MEESWRWPSLGPGFGLSTCVPPTTGLVPRAETRPGGALQPIPGRLFSTPRIASVRETPSTSAMAITTDSISSAVVRRAPPVRFAAAGGHVRIAKRNAKTPDGINIEGAGHIVIDGFVINEMPRAGLRITHSAGSTIRGVRADHNRSWAIFTSFCDDILIEGNTASRSIKEHGIYVSNSGDRPVIRGNTSRDNRMCGIHMNGDSSQGGDGIISNAVIENNIIFGNGPGGGSGINCDGLQNSKIQNNLLYNNHANGISLYRIDGAAGSTGNSVINNTVVQSADARWAVNIKNQSRNNLVVNNILFHDGSRGAINIAADSLSGFRSDFNIVVDQFSPDDGESLLSLSAWQSATGLDRRTQVSNPHDVFVNHASGDYHLRDGSPAIDAADPRRRHSLDIEGRRRPAGARPDAGAYEANAGVADNTPAGSPG